MAQAELARPAAAAVRIRLRGRDFDCSGAETVLDALLRQGAEVAYSCRKGACLTCLLRVERGAVLSEAQAGLKATLRDQGYFLPCLCVPGEDLDLAEPESEALFARARVAAVERLAPRVTRLLLEPEQPLAYHAGQFVNLRRPDGLVRSYSLASVPSLDGLLELHVKELTGGRMSGWICRELGPGTTVEVQGPNGTCYYLAEAPDQPLLLIGNGTGLAPLIGIARDALRAGHRGPIRLYHGTRQPEGLYLHRVLHRMASDHASFRYLPCLSGPVVPDGCRTGRVESVAFSEHRDLTGYRVHLCGYPPMVEAAKKMAYLKGARLDDIYADPFELRELRREPRS